MKKNTLLYNLLFVLGAISFASCSEDTEGLSRITTYAVMELNGDSFVKINVGESFDDPGCTATMGSEDVTDQVSTTTNLDVNKAGFYTVDYSVVNEDGFSAYASRSIMVVNPNSMASAYLSTCQYGTRVYNDLHIMVSDLGNGQYLIEDLMGGFYCKGRYPGYEAAGYDFYAEAVLQLNNDNSISLVSVGSHYWGGEFAITEGTYEPETGTITLVLDWDGDPFYVTLTK